MLQKTRSLQSIPATGSELPASVSLKEGIDFALGFLRRRYWIILASLLLALAVAAGFIFITPPSFTASATMMIDARKVQFLQQPVLSDVPIDAAWIETQIGVVKSENVGLAVVKQLRLVEEPRFAQPAAGFLSSAISRLLGRTIERAAPSEGELARQIVGPIEVRRVGISYVVRVDFTSPYQDLAVKVVNAIVDAYITEQLNAKYQSNRRTSDWLQERFQTLREQASAAERAVVEFKAKNNIVTSGGRSLSDQEVAELNSQLNIARAHSADVQARLSRIQAILRTDEFDPRKNETISDFMNNPTIQKLQLQFLDLANREADWKVRYGQEHTAVVNLRKQMRDIARSMQDEFRRIAETFRSEYEIAKGRQAELESRLAGAVSQSQDPAQIALHGLESAAASYQTLYTSFLQRYMESVQQQSYPGSEARMLSPASGAYKSYPQTSIVWVLAILGGTGLGLGFGVLREVMDGVFRTSKQVETALETDCLALVPMVKDKGSERSLPARQSSGGRGERRVCAESRMLRAVVDAPLSSYAEALRSLKLSVDLPLHGTKSLKVLGLTSTVPDEGKSTLAVGMASIMALAGGRVILVDCDLRNPSLSRALAPEATVGILDVVSGSSSLEEAIWKEPSTKMSFLPVVDQRSLMNSSDILAAPATRKLFDELRARYDYVIVDLPPLVPIVDVRAASGLVDSFILVIEWGRTKVDMAQHALKSAISVHENIMGAVLNKVDMGLIGKYERKDAKYYRNSSYARYGYQQ